MSRELTLAGYAVIAAALVAYALRGRTKPRQLLAWLTARPATRWPLLAAWLWLGWHLFARVDWR
jgi:hypothetical protein